MHGGEQSWILKALREAGSELIDQFYGLSRGELRWRPLDDERSLEETILHLRDREELSLRQIQLIAEADGEPLLPIESSHALPSEQDCQSQDTREALRAFARLRSQTSMTLWELSAYEWERCGRHPYRGPVSIAQIARELTEHDLSHLWKVRRLRQRLSEREQEEEIR